MPIVSFDSTINQVSFESPCKFEQQDFLGEGAVGHVYKGLSGDQTYVAIKVPNHAEQAELINSEGQLLKGLRQKAGEHRFVIPEVAIGYADNSPNMPCLIMPFYDVHLKDVVRQRLAPQDYAKTGLTAEIIGIEAAIDYTFAIEALHEAHHRTCTDRKLDDFFIVGGVKESQNRTIVIDWNVLRDLTPEFLGAEMRQFGDRWQEMYFGIARRPPLDSFSDKDWQPGPTKVKNIWEGDGGLISVGLRLILAKTVHPDLSQRFVDPRTGVSSQQRLRETLQKWQSLLTMSTDQLMKVQEPLPHIQLSDDERLFVLHDLVWRLRRAEGSDTRQITTTWEARLDDLRRVNATRDIAGQIVAAWQRGDSIGAAKLVDDAFSTVKNQVLLAHLRRWRILLKLADVYKESKSYSRPVEQTLRSQFQTIGKNLHVDPQQDESYVLQEAVESLAFVGNTLKEFYLPELDTLATEVEFRRRAAHFRYSASLSEVTLTEQNEVLQTLDHLLRDRDLKLIDPDPQAEGSFTRAVFDVDQGRERVTAGIKMREEQQRTELAAQVRLALEHSAEALIEAHLQREDGNFAKALAQGRKDLQTQADSFTSLLDREVKKPLLEAEGDLKDLNRKISTLNAMAQNTESFGQRADDQEARLAAIEGKIKGLDSGLVMSVAQNTLEREKVLKEIGGTLQELTVQFITAIPKPDGPFDLKAAMDQLNKLKQSSDDPTIVEVLTVWLRRLSDYALLYNFLSKVKEWLAYQQDAKNETPQAASDLRSGLFDLRENMILAVLTCPSDAFSPVLYSQWQAEMVRLEDLMKKLMPKENVDGGQDQPWWKAAKERADRCKDIHLRPGGPAQSKAS